MMNSPHQTLNAGPPSFSRSLLVQRSLLRDKSHIAAEVRSTGTIYLQVFEMLPLRDAFWKIRDGVGACRSHLKFPQSLRSFQPS